tara:strand:+ start:302 stop:646 length:345 start_codon:yes stop_codon:yes gene_type:complete
MKIPIIIIAPRFTKAISWVIEVGAITLFPFIISRKEMSESLLRHETIHIAQQKELLVILFYILYVWDFIKGYLKYGNKEIAYYQIRFEQEAYEHMYDKKYLDNRKRFSWLKYRV